MVITTPESYTDMLDRTKAGKYTTPVISVTSSRTLSAALQGFIETESDGIVQVSSGGAVYWSGSSRADRVKGSLAVSAYTYSIADLYPIIFTLHTDHCPHKLVDAWLRPLLEIEIEQAKRDKPTAFQSHVQDGPAETLGDNIKLVIKLLAMSKKADTILEIEIGAVGSEEDGIKGEESASLYTTTDDTQAAVEALGLGENGRYTAALIFGNVHGAYKPGHVKLHPELLGGIQADVVKRLGDRLATKVGDKKTPLNLVIHGGSDSTAEEVATAVHNDVIKVSVDTDTQYTFMHPVADHMFKDYDDVFKIDGKVGSKKAYDPCTWDRAAEKSMAARVIEAYERLGSVGSTRK